MDLETSPNLIKDEGLEAIVVDRIWISDITYIPTSEGWLYLCFVLDLCSRNIVGWSMGADTKADIIMEAKKMALKARNPPQGLVSIATAACSIKRRSFAGSLIAEGFDKA